MGTWNAWDNQYWPAKYLIDAQGHVRYAHFGEGSYGKTEAAIRALLKEPGAMAGKPSRTYDPAQQATPETYLGAERAQGFVPGSPRLGTHDYVAADDLPHSTFSLGGRWTVTDESATAGIDASLRANVTGKDVYLVLSGPGTVDVTVDGRHEQTVRVTTQKLYHLLSRRKSGAHDLQLRFSPGVIGYAFTFG